MSVETLSPAAKLHQKYIRKVVRMTLKIPQGFQSCATLISDTVTVIFQLVLTKLCPSKKILFTV